MELKFFKPKSEILQQFIEGYYFLSLKKTEPKIEYLTFPNNYSIVSFHENIQVDYFENKVVMTDNQKQPFSSSLICNYKKPIQISYSGYINEITFYFKPLGLNFFLKKPLSFYTNNFFSEFIPFDDYQKVMTTILREENQEIQIDLIENYWLSKLIGFNHSFLNELLIDIQNEYSMKDLAIKYNTSRQNINKHFETNLCKSPSDFKKIQRFRQALKSQIDRKSKNSLTSLSYDFLFYDQSHLIKDFKSLTGLTPKKFFKNLSSQEEGQINWLFV